MSDLHVDWKLMSQFVEGRMTDEESSELLRLIEKDPRLARLILENQKVDFWLKRKYSLLREEKKTEDSFVSNVTKSLSDLLDESVLYEKEAVPIPIEESPDDLTLPSSTYKSLSRRSNAKSNRGTVTQMSRKRRSNISFIALVLFYVSFLTWLSLDYSQKETVVEEPTFRGFATVAETINAVWEPGKDIFRRGQSLLDDRLYLKSGVVKIVFVNGADLILEGPTELFIREPMKTTCMRGQISASIPPKAVGFEMMTPSATIVDRGTAFYVHVQNEETEVGVVKGLVDFQTLEEPSVSLSEGIAMKVTPTQKRWKINLDKRHFMDFKIFDGKLSDYQRQEKEKSQARARILDQDPNLLARFDVGDLQSNRITNRALSSSRSGEYLFLSSCNTAEGSLRDRRAVGFQRPKSVAQLPIKKTLSSMTIFATIEIERLKNSFSVLFSSCEKIEQEGALVWQISNLGELALTIRTNKSNRNEVFTTSRCFDQKNRGVWVKVAVVIDAKRKTINQYIDGVSLGELPWASPIPIPLDQATIGNLSLGNKSVNPRYLGGNLEEFLIFDRPLTPDEIKKL